VRLSKTSAHAALAAAFLHDHEPTQTVQARQVADHLGIPTDSALKILQALARAGVLASRLGRAGGYRLSRPGGKITLLEIVEAIDGPVSGEMPALPATQHLATPVRLLREVCEHAARRLRHELGHVTVADLAARHKPPHTRRGGASHGSAPPLQTVAAEH
jgi:Rrf2 family protein